MNYNVSVNGENAKLLRASVFPMPYNEQQFMEYTQFKMDKPVDIQIRSDILLNSVIIRPLSQGIDYTYNEHEIFIHLEEPKKFSIEINNSFYNNLMVFAEAYAYEDFDKNSENVMYFGAGIHNADKLVITKDDTVIYLEEGAFINGKIELNHCKNIMICGYGTISMEQYPLEVRPIYNRCVDVLHCRDIVIKDITITDSNDWSLRVLGCDNVTVENVKIIGCRGNSDGIDICGSRNVLVQRVFTRVWDDSLVVKAFDTGDVYNVVFKDSILWNDFARPIEVGVELRADKVSKVRFENIDIIHSPTGYPLMGIHHGDRAEISDILFENIRIENTPGAQLFDIRIAHSFWNRDKEMGCIKDITFKNIYYVGNPGMECLLSNSRLQGFSDEHNIKNVTFENINILGKTATNAKELGLICMDHVENVVFQYDENISRIEQVQTELSITKDFTIDANGLYSGQISASFYNTSEKYQKASFWLQISPAHVGEYDREVQLLTLEAKENATYDYDIKLPPGKYVLSIQSSDVNISYAWKYLQLDLIIKEENKDYQTAELEFINYYNVRTKGVKMWVHKDNLVVESDILKDNRNNLVIYTAMPVEKLEGEVLFSVEETDFGVVPAVLYGKHGLELAPQLRCPLEITLVFKNEPKVKEIREFVINGGGNRRVVIPFENLGLEKGTKNFWLEVEARTNEVKGYRYPYTLFHSVMPAKSAHMFSNVHIK